MKHRCNWESLGAGLLTLVTAAGTSLHAMGTPPSDTVRLPRRLMFATEVLEEIHRQTGRRYAYPSDVLVRQIDTSEFDGQTDTMTLAARLAPVAQLREGALVLSRTVDEDLLAALTLDVRNGDAETRRAAAYRLGNLGCSQAIAPLMAALRDEQDDSVRHHALRSLDRLERDFLRQAPPGRISVFALETPFPDDLLLDRMRAARDRSENEWIWSATILGRRGAREAAPLLHEALTDDYIGASRMARWALDRIESARPKPDPAVSRFDPAPLLRAFARQTDDNERAETILALGRIGGPEIWNLTLKLLDDPSPTLRRAALRALGRCPDPAAVTALMHWLTAPNIEVEDRNLAGMSLGLIASDAAVETLSDYVLEADQPMSAAVLGLGFMEDPRAERALIRCASWPGRGHGVMKGYAFMGLARLGTAAAADTLMKHRNQYDNTARSVAFTAIRLAGAWNQSAVDRYVSQAKASSAAHGLEMAEDPAAVDALLALLPGSSGAHRLHVTQSLGRIGDPKAVPALIEAMNTAPSARDRTEAMRALRWRWYWHRPDVRAALHAHPQFRALTEPPPSPEAQEENTWVLRRWAADFDDDRIASTTYEAGLVFDEATGLTVKWGAHGDRCDSPQTSDTWLFDTETGRWRESRSPVSPHGMCGTWGMAYDRAARAVVSVQAPGANHGWQWNRARALRAASPWIYEGERDVWTPMQRIESGHGPGMRGFHTPAYHDPTQTVFFYGGQWGNFNRGDLADRGWIYDTYANQWSMLDVSDPLPGSRAHHGMCYLPSLNRILMVAGSYGKADRLTWLYDLENNVWTNTEAIGDVPPRLPVVYDPVSQTALWFGPHQEQGTRVRQYDPVANVWRDIPAPAGLSPHYFSVGVAYDPIRNLFVMSGGLLSWDTGHIAIRETWTYRFKKRDAQANRGPTAPDSLIATTRPDRTVRLTWQPVPDAAGYAVYRSRAANSWQTRFEKIATLPAETTEYAEPGETIAYYRVAALDAHNAEGPPSLVARTQPPLPRDLVASVQTDRTVRLDWKRPAVSDATGYHVYAATVETGTMHPESIFRKVRPLERLTEKPVRDTAFTDTRPLTQTTDGEFSHEMRAYEIRAVNAWGVESGPCAMAMTIPSPTPRVRARELPDGVTLVEWDPAPEQNIRGYRLYRMDEFNRSLVFQVNYAPVAETRFSDVPEIPRSERRRYYVVTVNALGQEGVPSSGAYAFGRP